MARRRAKLPVPCSSRRLIRFSFRSYVRQVQQFAQVVVRGAGHIAPYDQGKDGRRLPGGYSDMLFVITAGGLIAFYPISLTPSLPRVGIWCLSAARSRSIFHPSIRYPPTFMRRPRSQGHGLPLHPRPTVLRSTPESDPDAAAAFSALPNKQLQSPRQYFAPLLLVSTTTYPPRLAKPYAILSAIAQLVVTRR